MPNQAPARLEQPLLQRIDSHLNRHGVERSVDRRRFRSFASMRNPIVRDLPKEKPLGFPSGSCRSDFCACRSRPPRRPPRRGRSPSGRRLPRTLISATLPASLTIGPDDFKSSGLGTPRAASVAVVFSQPSLAHARPGFLNARGRFQTQNEVTPGVPQTRV